MTHTYGTAAQRKRRRQDEAAERQARHDALTPAEKLSKALKHLKRGDVGREYNRLKGKP